MPLTLSLSVILVGTRAAILFMGGPQISVALSVCSVQLWCVITLLTQQPAMAFLGVGADHRGCDSCDSQLQASARQ